ncbi:acetyl-CoA carboxylase biotin carboxyl carrier protein [Plantactinospora sp. S1510]|uniref:Biotin carboxyl carrier protein of acetyl-CoA carboxylase n=1 Tax=Plantactinospora alkalitolerans TaxID=2789879 RepID=A0ABS0H3G7_9ACTN|nr:acetyl-CoA carboxylase biotin carboxyl carrier protein [Plantactinospora alkalitolerans]MBF9133007.1 acetyl-CoA carboxylase biotin carboxyl carrier protein [Plantactinospora alkalitolerans]
MTRASVAGNPELVVPVGGPADLAGEPELVVPVGGPADLAGNSEPKPAGVPASDSDPDSSPDSESEPEPAPVGGTAELAELCRQAGRLVTETAGPLRRIRLRSGEAVLEIEWHGGEAVVGPGTGAAALAGSAANSAPSAVPAVTGAAIGSDGRRTVLAPMVGTYYQAAEPGGPPFVEVGDKVEPGQVVCIVEAMKLMNEVVADQVGRVVEVLVHDGEPVEFGQPLIALVSA